MEEGLGKIIEGGGAKGSGWGLLIMVWKRAECKGEWEEIDMRYKRGVS